VALLDSAIRSRALSDVALTVLVTGLSGLIGRALHARVGTAWNLRALNRSPVAGVPCHRADIGDFDAIRPAFAGVDVVVHLAATVGNKAPDEDILRVNVRGTYNVYEAARQAGVKRVVFASSGSTVSAIEREQPYRDLVAGRLPEAATWPLLTHESAVRPNGLYGCSKVWGETLARHYAQAHGMSMICVRIGHVSAEDRPMAPREYSVFCSQRDIARGLELCVTAPPTVRFDVVFVTSRNRRGYRDLEHTRAVLGYEPLDAAEDYR
jgi:nucleoside-diphosphate-sugar epimerase